VGRYSFQASWQGDSSIYGALSDRIYVDTSMISNSNFILYVGVAAIVIAVIAVAIIIVVKKRPKKMSEDQTPAKAVDNL
jgi:hypothetical protein